MTNNEAIARLQAAADIAITTGCELAKMPAKDALAIADLLKEQETVVRCKDCKYCVKEPTGELYCDILAVGYEPLGSKKVNEDWYCADGKRRVTQE